MQLTANQEPHLQVVPRSAMRRVRRKVLVSVLAIATLLLLGVKVLVNWQGHSNSIESVAFSPDGKKIVTGSRDETAKVWDAQTGRVIRTFKGHSHYVVSAVFSPDGKKIVTGYTNGDAKVWDAQTGKEICTLKGNIISKIMSD